MIGSAIYFQSNAVQATHSTAEIFMQPRPQCIRD
jgi:hypothetical protein